MTEWSIVRHWKCRVRVKLHRGFESLPLRYNIRTCGHMAESVSCYWFLLRFGAAVPRPRRTNAAWPSRPNPSNPPPRCTTWRANLPTIAHDHTRTTLLPGLSRPAVPDQKFRDRSLAQTRLHQQILAAQPVDAELRPARGELFVLPHAEVVVAGRIDVQLGRNRRRASGPGT